MIGDSVGKQNHNVTRSRVEVALVIFLIRQQAQRHAFHVHFVNLAVAQNHGWRSAGVGHRERGRVRVPQHQQQGHVAAFHAPFHQPVIHGLHQFGWIAAARRQTPHESVHHGAVKCRRGTLTAGIAEGDLDVGVRVVVKIVEVTGNLPRRAQTDGDVQSLHFRRFGGKKNLLQLESRAQIFFHQFFTTPDFLVQAGILHRDGYRRRQQFHGARMFFGEETGAFAFQIEHSNYPVLNGQRYRQLRMNAGVGSNIARVCRGVVHPYGLAGHRRRPGDSFAQRDVVQIHPLVIAHAETEA